jgi:tetratricopeptide (TPR) repeat protein
MAKPMLVTLPCVLLLLDYWPLNRTVSRPWTKLVSEKIPLLGLAAVSSWITIQAQAQGRAVLTVTQAPIEARLGNTLIAYAGYLRNALWPARLSAFYPYPAPANFLERTLVAAAILTLVSASVLAMRRQRPYLLVGWLWYLGTLIPVIGLVQVGVQAMADRYTYIPLIGILVMVAWSARDTVAAWRIPRAAVAFVATLLLAACAAVSLSQIECWNDSIRVWQHALEATESNYMAEYLLGLAVAQKGDQEAANLMQQGRTLDAELVQRRTRREAIARYQSAVKIQSSLPELHYALGRALAAEGKPAAAEQEYLTALDQNRDYAEAYTNLGGLYQTQGRLEDAKACFTKAVEIDPGQAEGRYNLAGILMTQGKVPEAIDQLEAALQSSKITPEIRQMIQERLNQYRSKPSR